MLVVANGSHGSVVESVSGACSHPQGKALKFELVGRVFLAWSHQSPHPREKQTFGAPVTDSIFCREHCRQCISALHYVLVIVQEKGEKRNGDNLEPKKKI